MRLPTQSGGGIVPGGAYDLALKELFVCNPDMNTVEVYSTVDGHRLGGISIPGPAGLSFSPGDSKLVIGTITPYVYIADPATLHVTRKIQVPASLLTTNQTGATLMPLVPFAMADGSIFLGMGANPESGSYSYTLVSHLITYDPTNGSFTPEDPGTGEILGNPAVSLDGKWLFTEGLGNSGQELFLYSTAAHAFVTTSSALPGTAYNLAANADGSQFVSVQTNPAPGVVTFWGSTLQIQNQYTLSAPITGNPIFSRDGKYLYFMSENGILTALNTQTGMPMGYVGVSGGSLLTWQQYFDVDETYHLFGTIGLGGVLMVNAAQLQASPPAAMALFIGPSTEANPNVGPAAGGTQVQFIPTPAASGGSADGIVSSMEAYFGATPATQDVVAPYPSSSNGGNFLTATAPPVKSPGPVSVLLTDASNNPVFLPDAFTYGPHLLRVEPNVASPRGGDSVTITAYGLGFFFQPDLSQSDIRVTIGGTPVDMRTAKLNSYASSNYPEQSVTVPVPPGTSGWADITLTTGNGSDTLKRGLQYLKQETHLPGGPFTFAVYDSVRDRFYLTGNGNSVAVFDPGSLTLIQPLQSSAISPGAVLQGEALTPDGSKLVVADPSDQLVVVFDLSAGTSTTVSVTLPSDPPNTTFGAPQPLFVSTLASNRAFVSIVPCIPSPVREIDLTTLGVSPRPDAASTCGTYVPYPEMGGSSGDGSTIIYAGNSGLQPPGPEYIWRYDAASDAFSGPVLIQDSPWVGGKAAADGNGGVIALSQGVLDQRLLPQVPLSQGGLDSRLNETGSLLYSVDSSVFVSDTQNGRRLLMMALPSSIGPTIGPYRPLAIDPLGRKVLVAREAGISYLELAVVPLGLGTVSPAQASAGMSITIRGSGFVSGTAVRIEEQSATCTETDSETLSCTVPNLAPGFVSMTLINPDGQSYSVEGAFSVQ